MRREVNRLSRDYNIPNGYGIAYYDFRRAMCVCYPKPFHLVVRHCRTAYWKFLRLFYSLGFIDTKPQEEFRWGDFFRVQSG